MIQDEYVHSIAMTLSSFSLAQSQSFSAENDTDIFDNYRTLVLWTVPL